MGACLRLGAFELGLVCCALCACSSFDPVSVPNFEYLQVGDNPGLGITGAEWVAYDDQHSRTSACTNGATGNHDPSECSELEQPHFEWEGSKCPDGKSEVYTFHDAKPNGPVCIRGWLRKMLPCELISEAQRMKHSAEAQCVSTTDLNGKSVDTSNMWGAGVGLAFNSNEGWNAPAHGVIGVSFDLSVLPDTELGANALNLRVEIPIALSETLALPRQEKPVTRSDGSVIGPNGKLYRYDCKSTLITQTDFPERTGTVADLAVDGEPMLITSQLHPQGSPFWQPGTKSLWQPSPIKAGHNEFKWSSVLPPAESGYEFDAHKIVGIHVQVVHPDPANLTDVQFDFCISNLAVLKE